MPSTLHPIRLVTVKAMPEGRPALNPRGEGLGIVTAHLARLMKCLHSDFDSSDLLASAELKDGNLAGIPVGKVLKKRVTRFGDSHLSPSGGTRIYRSRQVQRSSRPGLGADFIRQVERILSEIVAHPNLAACS